MIWGVDLGGRSGGPPPSGPLRGSEMTPFWVTFGTPFGHVIWCFIEDSAAFGVRQCPKRGSKRTPKRGHLRGAHPSGGSEMTPFWVTFGTPFGHVIWCFIEDSAAFGVRQCPKRGSKRTPKRGHLRGAHPSGGSEMTPFWVPFWTRYLTVCAA